MLVVSATAAEAAHVPAGLPLVITGLGKTAAAASTARALASYDDLAGLARALGYDPQERLDVGESDVVLATGDVFVTDPAVRDALAGRAHLVDMEGYAVAWAARDAGVHSAVAVVHQTDHSHRTPGTS